MVGNPPLETSAVLTAAASSVVLVISESENLARQIESYLRNAGHPVRCGWVTELDELADVLRRGAPDLLLCQTGERASLQEVVRLADRLCPELPVLLLCDRYDTDRALEALSAGARDAVCHTDPRELRRLEFVIQREYMNHQHLRTLRSTRLRLEDFESRHKQLLAGTNDAVAHIQEGILSHANPAFAALLGYGQVEDLLQLPLMDLVCPDHQGKVKEHLRLLAKGKLENKPLDCCLVRKDGNKVQISARLTSGTVDGENFIEMLIRAEAAQANESRGASEVPSGRLAFFEALTAAINSTVQRGAPKAAMLVSIDQYDTMEERLGMHDAEEAVLLLMGWLRERLGEGASVYRFSTGELAFLVQRERTAAFEELGQRLVNDVLEQVFNTAGHEVQLTISIGTYPLAGGETALNVVTELARETRALTRNGGKQFANFGPTAKNSQQEREQARRVEQLKRAIEENRLKLAYQSIASLEGDTRQHFDVLVRMLDEAGKEQHAAEFVPLAEKAGLMTTIDRWVTARSLKVLSRRESSDVSSLFIKLSEDTLRDAEGYIVWLKNLLRERPLKPEEVVFAFQEATLESHIRKAKAMAKALTDLGGQIAIEHFGVSVHSAQLLQHVPAHFVKFHPVFMRQFNDKEQQRKMAELMEHARQRQTKTIVSHVEDANVMARLWQMGVNYIQGFHVQEPEVVLLSADLGR